MAKLTRRGFIVRTSAGALSVGALGVAPGLATVGSAHDLSDPELARAGSAGPIVAHVSNVASGEITILVGNRRIVHRDRDLVARLIKATR